jgi:hypothetical protein
MQIQKIILNKRSNVRENSCIILIILTVFMIRSPIAKGVLYISDAF